eukprot:2669746-Ditylum_brightwellii.AAC.1
MAVVLLTIHPLSCFSNHSTQGQNRGSGSCRGCGGCGGFGGLCCCGNGVSLTAMLRLADCC